MKLRFFPAVCLFYLIISFGFYGLAGAKVRRPVRLAAPAAVEPAALAVKEEPPVVVTPDPKTVQPVFSIGRPAEIAENTKTKDAVVIGGNLTINGEVERSAVAIGGSVILGPRAEVGENVVAIGGSIRKDDRARVRGKSIELRRPAACPLTGIFAQGGFFKMFWILKLITFVGFLGLAILAVSVIPAQIGLVSSAIETRLKDSVIWGLAVNILVVPVALLLLVSIVGILLIPLEAFLFLIVSIVGYIALSQFVGKKITIAFNKPGQSIVWETLIGIAVLFFVGVIPFIGWLVKICALVVGTGGVALVIYQSRQIKEN
jgi:hypothetical protein